MRKKPLFTVAFITGLLFLAVTGTLLVNSGKANPVWYRETIPIPKSVKRPTISINPQINNTAYNSNRLSLTLNVSMPEQPPKYIVYLLSIHYQRDWNDSVNFLYKYPVGSGMWISNFSENLTLADIPDGSHNVTFAAYADGGYLEGVTYYDFDIASYLSIIFSVDTTSPAVSISSIENRTYDPSDIPLNFTVNEPFSKVSYGLDGLGNVTVSGNTALAGLSIGEHNVTVFATDEVGNSGASETIFFTIEEPPELFPTTMVVAPIASVVVVGAGLVVYFKKRKK